MKGYLKGVYNISYNSCSFDAVLSFKSIHVYAYGRIFKMWLVSLYQVLNMSSKHVESWNLGHY
jgi:hypothetical protein